MNNVIPLQYVVSRESIESVQAALAEAVRAMDPSLFKAFIFSDVEEKLQKAA